MSESVQEQEKMRANLIVPPPIEEVIQSFEQADASFTVRDVHQALAKARRDLQNPTAAEDLGAWAETLAFALVGRAGVSPWGTFFGPVGSGTDEEGRPFYFPDIADATAGVVAHWADRARTLKHPVLTSRYADLVWEMAPVITGGRRDPEVARLAIDAYLAMVSAAVGPDLHHRFEAALRALDLGCMIHDHVRKTGARKLLMDLHLEAIEAKKRRLVAAVGPAHSRQERRLDRRGAARACDKFGGIDPAF
jgi:lysyl-tRNA synthetase class 1